VTNERHQHTTKLLACIKELREWVGGTSSAVSGAYPGHRNLNHIMADALSAIDDELAAIDAAARDATQSVRSA
jgi:hypothetical protein